MTVRMSTKKRVLLLCTSLLLSARRLIDPILSMRLGEMGTLTYITPANMFSGPFEWRTQMVCYQFFCVEFQLYYVIAFRMVPVSLFIILLAYSKETRTCCLPPRRGGRPNPGRGRLLDGIANTLDGAPDPSFSL